MAKEKLLERFEFEIDGKTFVSKKMNPILRGSVMKLMKNFNMPTSEKLTEEHEISMQNTDIFIDIIVNTPSVMWDFIKDEDKKMVGTYDSFLDSLCDNEMQVLDFFNWSFKKIGELSDFLGKGPKTAKEVKQKKLK
jgi:hypothetical protein